MSDAKTSLVLGRLPLGGCELTVLAATENEAYLALRAAYADHVARTADLLSHPAIPTDIDEALEYFGVSFWPMKIGKVQWL
jgi:hypothetical protein